MTTITFLRSGETFWAFRSCGHTGYAEEGSDILCAAISSMSLLVVNTIESGFGAPVDYQIDEETPALSVSVPALIVGGIDENICFAVSRLIDAYRRQLQELAGDYPKNIRVVIRAEDP